MIGQVPLLAQRIYSPVSLDQRAKTRDDVVAIADTLSVNQRSSSVAGMEVAQRPYLVPLEEAALGGPTNRG